MILLLLSTITSYLLQVDVIFFFKKTEISNHFLTGEGRGLKNIWCDQKNLNASKIPLFQYDLCTF